MIQFVTASHDENILRKNLFASDAFRLYPLTVQTNFRSVAKAYNQVKIKDIGVYLHHDVFLPSDFISKLKKTIKQVSELDPNWGVLGVAGVKEVHRRKFNFGHINDRGTEWGLADHLPHEVDTLDEVLLITKGDFLFDEKLPGNHFYGADICLQARDQRRKSYAIDAYLFHNSKLRVGERTDEFRQCEQYFKDKWKKHLPIYTTCSYLT